MSAVTHGLGALAIAGALLAVVLAVLAVPVAVGWVIDRRRARRQPFTRIARPVPLCGYVPPSGLWTPCDRPAMHQGSCRHYWREGR